MFHRSLLPNQNLGRLKYVRPAYPRPGSSFNFLVNDICELITLTHQNLKATIISTFKTSTYSIIERLSLPPAISVRRPRIPRVINIPQVINISSGALRSLNWLRKTHSAALPSRMERGWYLGDRWSWLVDISGGHLRWCGVVAYRDQRPSQKRCLSSISLRRLTRYSRLESYKGPGWIWA